MTLSWEALVSALGAEEASASVLSLISDIGEVPNVSDTPDEYNDPLGKTRFYQFTKTGLEVGFRQNRLNHMHLFIREQEGYEAYKGPLEDGLSASTLESELQQMFGAPSSEGSRKQSSLLGKKNRWVKFDKDHYALRYEFSNDGALRKVSLILL
ncbi:MAG: hypothetical protein WCC64_13610 [Aliidongia sp.]